MQFLRSALRVTARHFLVWRSVALTSAVGNFGEPLLYLFALGYGLGKVVPELEGASYAQFIAPGLVLATVMKTATFECTLLSFSRLEARRTYEAILATPITVPELVCGEIVWGACKSTFGAAVVLSALALLGLVPSWHGLWLLPLAFVAGFLFSSLALIVTALAKGPEPFNYYFVLFMTPMFLFSGVFFPLDRAPEWAATLATFLPLTHVVILARSAFRGEFSLDLWAPAAVVIAFLVLGYTASLYAMRRRLVV